GSVSPTTAEHVLAEFTPDQLLVLDGGPCRVGIESTVLRLDPPTVLRPGAVLRAELEAVLGCPVGLLEGSRESPGQLERHYAPATPALRCRAWDWPELRRLHPAGVAVLGVQPPTPPPDEFFPLSDDPAAYAAGLYAELRRADRSGASLIVVLEPDRPGGLWDAVRDRLRRATRLFGA
ncbi:MAG: Sua5 family C-terminal domain-containing protein, partial [Candidatus Eremiobacterota bacterium]